MKSKFKELQTKELPELVNLRKFIGVGLVVTGLAMGTGELILWPHLAVKYGLGILWGALLGITLQFFINREVGRLEAATGESFFTSSSRFFPFLAIFWFICAFILYIWPGWATTLGTILQELFGFGNYLMWSWISLAIVLILTFLGKTAYSILEKVLKIIVPVFFVLILIITILSFNLDNFVLALKGLINFGWFPQNINLEVFLGATVFAGAGGLLNLAVSLWYKDKGIGMGSYAGKITNPITGKTEAIPATGYKFETTQNNLKKWKKWIKLITLDQGLIFWLLGLITLTLVSLNAYTILTPLGLVPEGLDIAITQANIFGVYWGEFGYRLFLVMAFFMLFSVMWTVLDAFTRIISDILYVNSQDGPYQKPLKFIKKFSIHQLYYGLITIFVIINAILIPLREPLIFLTLSSVLGGLVMAIYLPLILYLEYKILDKKLRAGFITQLILFLGFIFYLGFSVYLIIN